MCWGLISIWTNQMQTCLTRLEEKLFSSGIFGIYQFGPWSVPHDWRLPVQWCFMGKYVIQLWVFPNFCLCLMCFYFFFLLFRGSRADFLCEQVSREHHHQQRPVHYSLRGSPRSHLFLFGFLASWLSQKEALHCSNNCCHPLHRVRTGKSTLGFTSRCKEWAWFLFFPGK